MLKPRYLNTSEGLSLPTKQLKRLSFISKWALRGVKRQIPPYPGKELPAEPTAGLIARLITTKTCDFWSHLQSTGLRGGQTCSLARSGRLSSGVPRRSLGVPSRETPGPRRSPSRSPGKETLPCCLLPGPSRGPGGSHRSFPVGEGAADTWSPRPEGVRRRGTAQHSAERRGGSCPAGRGRPSARRTALTCESARVLPGGLLKKEVRAVKKNSSDSSSSRLL